MTTLSTPSRYDDDDDDDSSREKVHHKSNQLATLSLLARLASWCLKRTQSRLLSTRPLLVKSLQCCPPLCVQLVSYPSNARHPLLLLQANTAWCLIHLTAPPTLTATCPLAPSLASTRTQPMDRAGTVCHQSQSQYTSHTHNTLLRHCHAQQPVSRHAASATCCGLAKTWSGLGTALTAVLLRWC